MSDLLITYFNEIKKEKSLYERHSKQKWKLIGIKNKIPWEDYNKIIEVKGKSYFFDGDFKEINK